MVFGLEVSAVVDPLVGPTLEPAVGITAIPTVNWDLSDLDFAPGRRILDVVPNFDDPSLLPFFEGTIAFTDQSISIDYDNLIGAGANIDLVGGSTFETRARFDIVTNVPLPPAFWLLFGAIAALRVTVARAAPLGPRLSEG
ncbi:MAG: hypothetical protein ACFBSD_13735 [Paracoccaceae bacterium]